MTDKPRQHDEMKLAMDQLPEHLRAKARIGTAQIGWESNDGKEHKGPIHAHIFFHGLTDNEERELVKLGYSFDLNKLPEGAKKSVLDRETTRKVMRGGGFEKPNHEIEKPTLDEFMEEVKPKLNLDTIKSVASALISGKRVSKKQQKARMEVCHGCNKFRWNGKVARCGVCGCKLSGKSGILQLTSFIETEKYGCKHPAGSRWKEAGV